MLVVSVNAMREWGNKAGIMASVGEKEKTCWVRREEDWEREDSR